MKPSEGSTVIGKSVTIRGDVSGKEDLFMDGVVEGTISLPENRLTVGPNAHVHADVDARDVVIFGSVEGNLHATGRVELRESAMVQGDIFASRLSIEENASIRGKIDMSATAVSVPAVRLPETHAAAGNDAAMDLS
jgi:cytoskeletal protein CcmA (bactofilin family)